MQTAPFLTALVRLVLHAEPDTKAGEHYHTALANIDDEEGQDRTARDDDSGATQDEEEPAARHLPRTTSLGDGWEITVKQAKQDNDETEDESGDEPGDGRMSRASSHEDFGDYDDADLATDQVAQENLAMVTKPMRRC